MGLNSVFTRTNTLLIIIDIQEKLAKTMSGLDCVVKNTIKLIRAARLLQVPIMVTEQYPEGLGRTLPELESLLINAEPIEKLTFSCCLEERFNNALSIESRSHIIIAGMEAHICVLQTALDLRERGYVAGVVQDAVCSYNRNDMDAALNRMRDEGVKILTTEMVLYELLRRAGTDEFKALLPLLKDRDR
ncbi:hydrolase [candidate division KSB1 bacterium]